MPSPFSAPHDILIHLLGTVPIYFGNHLYKVLRMQQGYTKMPFQAYNMFFLFWFFEFENRSQDRLPESTREIALGILGEFSEIPGFETFAGFFLTIGAFLVYKS